MVFASEMDPNTDEVELSSTDFGINFGVGYLYNNLSFDVQYSHGLKNMNLPDPDDPSYDPDSEKITNSVFSISVSYFW